MNHQWRAGASLDLFELRFDSAVAHVRIYTAEHAAQPDLGLWSRMTETHAGSSATMTVRGVDSTAPATVYTSQHNELYYSSSEVLGALYYWSTGAQGVMRGHISSSLATKFFTDPETGDRTCVACHTVLARRKASRGRLRRGAAARGHDPRA